MRSWEGGYSHKTIMGGGEWDCGKVTGCPCLASSDISERYANNGTCECYQQNAAGAQELRMDVRQEWTPPPRFLSVPLSATLCLTLNYHYWALGTRIISAPLIRCETLKSPLSHPISSSCSRHCSRVRSYICGHSVFAFLHILSPPSVLILLEAIYLHFLSLLRQHTIKHLV